VLSQDPRVEVLVVDDDSPDGTGKCADDLALESPRVHVLHRAAKQGLGPAYRAGIARALELGAECVVQMDADFSHPPAMLTPMLDAIGDYDVVSGSRYLEGITVVNWPIERILISYFGNAYVRRVTGLRITDTTGGFRCVRREMLERIGIERVAAKTEPNLREMVIVGTFVQGVPPALQFQVTDTGPQLVSLGRTNGEPDGLFPAVVHLQVRGETPPVEVFVNVIWPLPAAPGV